MHGEFFKWGLKMVFPQASFSKGTTVFGLKLLNVHLKQHSGLLSLSPAAGVCCYCLLKVKMGNCNRMGKGLGNVKDRSG